MSINTVTDMTLTELAAIFDMSEKKAAFLEEQGCKMKVGHKAIVFESANAQHIASANVKMGVLNMAKGNKLGPASKSMIQDELAGAIDKLCDKLGFATSIFDTFDEDQLEEGDSVPSFDTDSVHVKNEVEAAYSFGSGNNKVKAIKELRSLTGLGLKEAKELVEKWIDNGTIGDGPKKEKMFEGIFSKKKKAPKKAASTKIKEGIMNTNVIQLKDATDVFQPVGGSGGQSVYFAIAIGDETNVAARIKGQKVSIRVEGKGVSDPEIRQTLIDAGLSEAGGGHFSLHLSVEPHLLKKTIGAVLFAIGQPFTQMTADVTPIMGEGRMSMNMKQAATLLETVQDENLVELGRMFSRMDPNEPIFWKVLEATDTPDGRRVTFHLYYRDVFLKAVIGYLAPDHRVSWGVK